MHPIHHLLNKLILFYYLPALEIENFIYKYILIKYKYIYFGYIKCLKQYNSKKEKN